MKTINTEQHLHAISGGTRAEYSFITGTIAFAGAGMGGLLGLVLAAAGRTPNLVAIVTLPIGGAFMGAVGGYAVGAVSYTIGNNIGSIVGAPFKIINFLFQPST